MTPRLPQLTPLLPLLLLLLFAMDCAAADRRAFDEATRSSDSPPAAVVREVPRRGQGAAQVYTVVAAVAAGEKSNEGWAPIRIVVSTEDLRDPTKYCTAQDESKPDLKGGAGDCAEQYVLDAARKSTLVDAVIPVAVQLHAERLLVQRVDGLLQVPQFTDTFGRCQHFKLPDEHKTTGVANADMVLYVAAGASAETWAVPCAVGSNGRPVAGALHVSPCQRLSVMHSARVAAQAIGHALGFGVQQMRAQNMLLEDVTDVRGNPSPVTVVKSPATLEKTKAHYGCAELQGMELLRKKHAKVERVYWSPRNAKDELMSLLGGLTAGLYTALTMAAFEGLGFYRAVWGWRSRWRGATAPAATSSRARARRAVPPNTPACSATRKPTKLFAARPAVKPSGHVVRILLKAAVPGAKRAQLLGRIRALQSLFFFCSVKGEERIPGSLHGSGSWCLDAEALKLKGTEKTKLDGYKLHAVCAEVQCGEGGTVKVKYLGAAEYALCPEGEAIDAALEGFAAGARIKCPKYEEVCTIAANGSSLVVPRVLSGAEQAKGAAVGPPGAEATGGAAGGVSSGAKAAAGSAAPPVAPRDRGAEEYGSVFLLPLFPSFVFFLCAPSLLLVFCLFRQLLHRVFFLILGGAC
ncbi:surface protease GP63 [Trypanosoma conorhini]|uniref:Leishmanolysin-like peptidase n=1 Tax=Trypanosoma conorhini TaxID=83891 RepID=A0A422MZD4_9TRYP|nr:surface protease GP63 [Trypanosoma conorhini]RNE98596.1 surface protease GP63 [Trypanosoma conorhini]